jgi:tetratricopeptide (TPR) repeat protein
MPAPLDNGVIKPLADTALPLVAWRLRNIAESRSRLLLDGMYVCANCHSFSRDGKTLGMDMDGPQNDKGLYAIAHVSPQISLANEYLIRWNRDAPKPGEQVPKGATRVGFLSQVSPDGKSVVTTINTELYTVNFTNYQFLQVFYPTRGILSVYSRATGRQEPLRGADDPEYVHVGATWSPDGQYLVFSRARAREAFSKGSKVAAYANDPNEAQIQYDLYRIPFNQGNGGQAEPIDGAARNGLSNTFPKISPDGRWIVFVQCRNGLLMRPDGQLCIVPARGGRVRRLRCNLAPMNSWHSFSPNGHWLVFSSKGRSPYTRMFLTHLDENGDDTPAIQIDNATAANRAVNIPEFVNIAPDGLRKLDSPATEQYRYCGLGNDLVRQGQLEPAIALFEKALALDPDYLSAHQNLGSVLLQLGRVGAALAHYQRVLELRPDFDAHYNMGAALQFARKLPEAMVHYQRALELNPDHPEAHNNLGIILLELGKAAEGIEHLKRALALKPDYVAAQSNLQRATGSRP